MVAIYGHDAAGRWLALAKAHDYPDAQEAIGRWMGLSGPYIMQDHLDAQGHAPYQIVRLARGHSGHGLTFVRELGA